MAHLGLAIDPTANDLFLAPDGNLAMVADAEAVGQHVRQRLQMFEGEWFLDTSAGVTWLQEIFGRQYDPVLIDAVTKAEVLDTDGVTGIEAFSLRYRRTSRGVEIAMVEVTTIYNEVASA